MRTQRHLHVAVCLALVLASVVACSNSGEEMRRQLNELQARNQADSLMTDDSLALTLCNYFDSHGTPNEQMLAHYLLARTYADMGEAPMALEAYHNAAECADTTSADCDYSLLMKVHGQSANLFLEQSMPNEMLEELQLEGHYARLAKDTMVCILAEEWKHMAYDMLGQPDKAFQTVQYAFNEYCRNGYFDIAAYCASPICAYLIEQDKYEEARKYIDFRKNYYGVQTTDEDIFYYYLGMYYIGIGQLDSAEIYLRGLYNHSVDQNNREAACKGLTTMYEKRGLLDSVAKYSKLSYQISDERIKTSNKEELSKIQALYNYTRNQKIAQERALEANRNKTGMIILAFLITLLFFCIMAYRHYKREQIKQMEMEYHHLIELQEQAKFDIIKIKDHESKELLLQKEQEILEYQQSMDFLRGNLKTETSLEPAIASSDIYNRFVFLASHPMEKVYKSYWKQLSGMIDRYLPTFRSTLYSTYHLKDPDYQLCQLIRLHFSLSEIGVLIDETPQYVSKRRKYLLKQIFHQEGKPELFDTILKKIK